MLFGERFCIVHCQNLPFSVRARACVGFCPVLHDAVIDFLHTKIMRQEPIIVYWLLCYATVALERAACGACGKSSMGPCVRACELFVGGSVNKSVKIALLILADMQYF